MTDPQSEPGIAVGQLFLEEATFSHRSDALSLPASTKPDVGEFEVQIQTGLRSDGKAGILRIRVSTRAEANPLYRVSLSMVGLFEEQPGRANMPVSDFVQGPGIQVMFPFVREALANLTGRGRFGPVWLNPFNTRAAQAALKQAAAKPEAAPPAEQ